MELEPVMSVEAIVEEALKLSPAELELLMERLADHLTEPADPAIAEAWNQEISRRMARYKVGESKAVEWEEARRRMFGSRE